MPSSEFLMLTHWCPALGSDLHHIMQSMLANPVKKQQQKLFLNFSRLSPSLSLISLTFSSFFSLSHSLSLLSFSFLSFSFSRIHRPTLFHCCHTYPFSIFALTRHCCQLQRTVYTLLPAEGKTSSLVLSALLPAAEFCFFPLLPA